MENNRRVYIPRLILICVVITGCNSKFELDIPEYVQELETVTIYPFEPESVPEINLVQELEFGNTDDVIIGMVERLSAFDQNRIYKRIEVDDQDRLYVADVQQLKIHIFNPDGTWLKSIGREGSGPGEFRQISEINIKSDHLYVTDAIQRRMHVFFLGSLTLSHSISLVPQNQYQKEELSNRFPDHYLIRSDGTVLTGFITPPFLTENPQLPDSLLFYIMDHTGQIESDRILAQQGFKYFTGTGEHQNAMLSFDFNPASLRVLSDDDYIYTNLSDELLIKVYNPQGEYLRAFYYPFDKMDLNRSELINRENRGRFYQDIIRRVDLPETHPVVRTMMMDDINRIWISTFSNDDDSVNWWVLNEEGEMLGRFSFPKNKWIREISNNRVYTIENDFETGEFNIERYRIHDI